MDVCSGGLTRGVTSGVRLCLIILSVLLSVSPFCLHDAIQASTVTKSTLPYPAKPSTAHSNNINSGDNSSPEWDSLYEESEEYSRHRHHVNRRDVKALSSIMAPIRIHVEFNIDTELRPDEQEVLQRVVTQTVDKVKSIFRVIPVEGNLLLQRSSAACASVWTSGPNSGKCNRLDDAYIGETCLDHFTIPDAHLEGFYLWDSSNPEPARTVYEPGAGAADTDYILYVHASYQPTCRTADESVIAYAAYCQTDQYSRPVVGSINFCPVWMRNIITDEDKLAVTALHEIFHALGFSKKLFKEYSDCTLSGSDVECTPHHNPVRNVVGAHRLVTPKLVEVTSAHFGCVSHNVINQFGPAIQMEGDSWTSHWDGFFMYGSIMTAKIGMASVTRLDEITLAAFEDMGWYAVNYQYAQDLVWGKGGGCDFGLPSSCEQDANEICQLNEKGCHHLHLHKGTCETTPQSYGCSLFTPDSEGSCVQMPTSAISTANGDSLSDDHRCFRTNITSTESIEENAFVGACFRHRCLDDSTLEVQVSGDDWIPCPYNSVIQVPGFDGVLECPPVGVLCEPWLPWIEVESITEPESSESSEASAEVDEVLVVAEPESDGSDDPNEVDDDGLICIEVVFVTANYFTLELANRLNDFLGYVIETVAVVAGVSRKRLTSQQILRGSIVVRFNVEPVEDATELSPEPSPKHVYYFLKDYVHAGNFSVRVYINETSIIDYIATDVRQGIEEPLVLTGSSPSPGIMAAIIIASLVIATLIGMLVLYIQRYYAATTRVIPRPDLPVTASRNTHCTQPTAEELLQWHAPPGSPNGYPMMEENNAFSESEEPTVEVINERRDSVASADDIVIEDNNMEATTVV